MDGAAVAALESALAADPENVALRLHLAAAVLEVGDAPRCLDLVQTALVARPTDSTALALAARAATACDEHALADSYAKVLQALGSAPTLAATRATGDDEDGLGVDAAFDAEVDAFLTNAAEDAVEVEEARLTLADVGGMLEVKAALERSFLSPMRNPELRRMYGKSLRGGLLMYGPPGCGKTFLARATAGELGASFFGIGLHEVLDMYLGQSERNLHGVFERARRNAPCVLFLDEIDALGQKRSNLARSAARNVVVQLLAELDGLGNENEGVFVLGATNQPWDVDPALRRPGRLDRTLIVLPPDMPARERILEVHLRGRPVDAVNLRYLAECTDGYSGADLRMLCETAAEIAIEESLKAGHARPISEADLLEATRAVSPSTRAWFDVARNVVTFANNTGEYDELQSYMRQHRLL